MYGVSKEMLTPRPRHAFCAYVFKRKEESSMVNMVSSILTKGIGLALCLSLLLLIGFVFPSSHAFAVSSSGTQAASAPGSAHHTAHVSPLINSTPCNGRHDLFQVYYEGNPGEVCYANAGRIFVNIYGLAAVKSGANSGYLSINHNLNIKFTYYQTLTFDPTYDELTYICIGHGC
jgi:hypothetical protein